MDKARMRALVACIAATAALFAGIITPAYASEEERKNGRASGQGQQDDENFQRADEESSSEEGPSAAQHTEDSDGPGKNWDNEGSPRGESSTQCENTHGGTGSGRVYDSTCEGSASKAGEGGGSAKGRPCAGCVGNADYKEPRGQLDDGDHDGDAGYECDGNNGVARSNPAHTSCRLPTTTNLCPPGTDLAGLPPGPNGCDIPPGNLCPPGTDLAGLPPGPNGCDLPPSEKCPPGSDREGLPPGPDGCNEDDVLGREDKVCPEGTDFAGEDMTNIKDCVLGKVIHSGGPKPPLGAALPFTGSGGMLPVVALGLLLLASGMASLMLRKPA